MAFVAVKTMLFNGESYNPNIESQYLRARYYCVVTATFLTEDSYLGNQTEPLTLNRYNYCVSSYLNYTDPSGNEVEVLESLKGWIIDPNTQAQKTIENYENQRLSIEDAIESGLLNNRAGQIFLDYGDIVMGPAVKTPADIIVIRETVKGNSDSKEMQRTATAGFYAGFVGQGIEYTQIISNADYQLSMIITNDDRRGPVEREKGLPAKLVQQLLIRILLVDQSSVNGASEIIDIA